MQLMTTWRHEHRNLRLSPMMPRRIATRGHHAAALAVTIGALFLLMMVGESAMAGPPSCTIVSGEPGGPAIRIDNQPHAPMFMCVNNQFGRDDVLVDEIRQAGAAGIDLISFNLLLDWQQSAEETNRTLARFCEANPNAYFYVRIWMGPSPEWLAAHPNDRIVAHDGTPGTMASPSSGAWLEDATARLEALLAQILDSPYAERFIGAMPTYLQTGEWFYPDTEQFSDYSPANARAFRDWLKKKYRRNKKLREAWGDSSVTLDGASLPSPEVREATAVGPFRDPVAHRAAADMAEFQSHVIVDAIETYCRVIKKATRNRALAGAFYGYTFELNHNGPRALAHSGHLALGALLDSPYIDLIHAPYAYFERGLGMPGHFHLPVDSIALHRKLAIMEEDSYTHLGTKPAEERLAPGWDQRTTTMEETLALNRRNFGQFMTHRVGFWWFDLLSDGRWNSPEFWEQAGMLRRIAAKVRDEPLFEPQVAFVVDETSVNALADRTHPYLLESLGQWRSELARLGTPVGYYLQSDLTLIPNSGRLFIMANPFRLSREQEREAHQRLEEGATIVWTFAPGVVVDDRVNFEHIRDVTGMGVVLQKTAGPLRFESSETEESWEIPEDWALRFQVADASVHPLATYAGSEAVAAAEVVSGKGISVYTAVPRLPVKLLQRLGARAGVHFYRPDGGMVGVAGDYLFVHTPVEAKEMLCWPEPMGMAVRLVPEGIDEIILGDAGCWQDTLPGKTTAIYRMERDKPLRSNILERLDRLGE